MSTGLVALGEQIGQLPHDLTERYRKKLDPNLSSHRRHEAEAILATLVDAELVYRTEKNAAARDYVLRHPDLSQPPDNRTDPGTGGTILHGVAEDPLWGDGVGAVEVHYYLRFEDYPRLGHAREALRTEEKRLAAYYP